MFFFFKEMPWVPFFLGSYTKPLGHVVDGCGEGVTLGLFNNETGAVVPRLSSTSTQPHPIRIVSPSFLHVNTPVEKGDTSRDASFGRLVEVVVVQEDESVDLESILVLHAKFSNEFVTAMSSAASSEDLVREFGELDFFWLKTTINGTNGVYNCHVTSCPTTSNDMPQVIGVSGYLSGTFSFLLLHPDAATRSITFTPPLHDASLLGSNGQRQEFPHAHQIVFLKLEQDLCDEEVGREGMCTFGVCLGTDRIGRIPLAKQLLLDGDVVQRQVQLSPQENVAFVAPVGSGPRHMEFVPVCVRRRLSSATSCVAPTLAVVSCELSARILLLSYLNNKFSLLSDLNSSNVREEEDIPRKPNSPAAIHCHPTLPFVFIANRFVDTIAVFEIGLATPRHGSDDNAGRYCLRFVSEVWCGGRTPRDFAVSHCGKWIVVGLQDSSQVAVIEISGGGKLKLCCVVPCPTPTNVVFF